MSESNRPSNPVRYYIQQSGALVEIKHPEFASMPVYVSDDDYQARLLEIERLTAELAERNRLSDKADERIRFWADKCDRLRAALERIYEERENVPWAAEIARKALAGAAVETSAVQSKTTFAPGPCKHERTTSTMWTDGTGYSHCNVCGSVLFDSRKPSEYK